MTLPVSLITTYLSLYERFLQLLESFPGRVKYPQTSAELHKKLNRVDRRLEFAVKRFLYLQPLSWQKEHGLLYNNPFGKDLADFARGLCICDILLCFSAMIARNDNPDVVLQERDQRVIRQYGHLIDTHFKNYRDEVLNLYEQCPFN